jgi:hypothetical protein
VLDAGIFVNATRWKSHRPFAVMLFSLNDGHCPCACVGLGCSPFYCLSWEIEENICFLKFSKLRGLILFRLEFLQPAIGL